MRKILQYAMIGILPIGLLNACIKDESVGTVKMLSEITITAPSDTLYAEYGLPFSLDCESMVTQTQEELALAYEWKAGFIDEVGRKDSLKLVSEEPVLDYAFKKLGQYWLRLRVSNEHGSSFKNFTVMVRSAFDEGLFVLSADEAGKGMVSFLRLLNESEVATPRESFMTDVLRTINPTVPLNGPVDVQKMQHTIVILSGMDQKLYYIDDKMFEIEQIHPLVGDSPGFKVSAFGAVDKSGASDPILLLLSENGQAVCFKKGDAFIYDSPNLFPESSHYDRLYTLDLRNKYNTLFLGCHVFVDNELSQINFVYDTYKTFKSGDAYAGQDIINLALQKDRRLVVISVDREDPSQVHITRYASVEDTYGPFETPQTTSYQLTSPLTLTTGPMVSCDLYNIIYYYNENRLFRWSYTTLNSKLPENPSLTLRNEHTGQDIDICCLALSPDRRYLYVGVYDPSSEHELKGGVYIYDADNLALVKKFEGISDKPLKVFYKIK